METDSCRNVGKGSQIASFHCILIDLTFTFQTTFFSFGSVWCILCACWCQPSTSQLS
uniref:Uncharacterized protein n=1 Tax=Aegilops tauschii subsp. strangulata TaxID=200361 RepID=A0A453GT10_AEGTS